MRDEIIFYLISHLFSYISLYFTEILIMPYSLVLNLLPVSPIYPQFLTGRHLHALFLQLVSHVDRDLATHLHDSYADKAFTLSPLQIRQPQGILQWKHNKPIHPETPCWWRISLLDDLLFGQLTQLWLNLNPEKPWHLGSADLHITSILGTPQSHQPWANACPYQQLYDRASETERQIAFIFATPTAFRQGKYDNALPTKESIFKSLLTQWNKYSGIDFYQLDLDAIFPSFFDIRTEIIKDSRSKFIGCIGEIHYCFLGEVESLQIKQINALADFSLYCGVGRKTTMGMGMVRRVNS